MVDVNIFVRSFSSIDDVKMVSDHLYNRELILRFLLEKAQEFLFDSGIYKTFSFISVYLTIV